MARVYRAYHPQLDRHVALKVLRYDLVDDEEFLNRFQREARAVAGLRHPNVVQVFDFDRVDDLYFMVMELLEGDTLKTRLDDHRVRGARMPYSDLLRSMLDVLNGLAYAHSEQMIHRDLKPANILLTKGGQAVIGDFGIAHIIGGTHYTTTGALMGTLEYMAPEQGLHGKSDARSDIYSLGVVLYEMLTQRVPFEAETPLAILMKHVNDPLPLPRSIDPEIPETLEQVVLKAMAKDPDDRYPSAAAMSRALKTAAAELDVALPDRISPPLSFTTDEAPSESVAVVSGDGREQLTDVGFAEYETDITLDRRLKAERLQAAGLQEAGAQEAGPRHRRGKVARGILEAVAIVGIGNLLAVSISVVLRNWAIFAYGWPMELLLVGSALSYLMAVTQSIWLIIPTGIILVNGLLLAYSVFTGSWHHWGLLWIVVAWSIAATVFVARLLAREPANARQTSRLLGWVGCAAALIVTLAVQGSAIALDLLNRIGNWLR
jgi:tRNA A-37 threonylcarbamoyl transferase component Bud32